MQRLHELVRFVVLHTYRAEAFTTLYHGLTLAAENILES